MPFKYKILGKAYCGTIVKHGRPDPKDQKVPTGLRTWTAHCPISVRRRQL